MSATFLLMSVSAVWQAQQILCQIQQFQFVESGATARIPCIAAEKIEDNGLSLCWFKSREDGMLVPIKSCDDDTRQGKFVCRWDGHQSTLEISRVYRDDSGFYLCASRRARFFFGSSLIVGGKEVGLGSVGAKCRPLRKQKSQIHKWSNEVHQDCPQPRKVLSSHECPHIWRKTFSGTTARDWPSWS